MDKRQRTDPLSVLQLAMSVLAFLAALVIGALLLLTVTINSSGAGLSDLSSLPIVSYAWVSVLVAALLVPSIIFTSLRLTGKPGRFTSSDALPGHGLGVHGILASDPLPGFQARGEPQRVAGGAPVADPGSGTADLVYFRVWTMEVAIRQSSKDFRPGGRGDHAVPYFNHHHRGNPFDRCAHRCLVRGWRSAGFHRAA